MTAWWLPRLNTTRALTARDAQSWADAEEAKAEESSNGKPRTRCSSLSATAASLPSSADSLDSERDARLYVKRYNELIGYGLEPDYVTEALGEPPEGVDTAALNTPETREDIACPSGHGRIQESTGSGASYAAMREYTGPMNKRGTYPKGPFMGLRGKAKRELWDRRND